MVKESLSLFHTTIFSLLVFCMFGVFAPSSSAEVKAGLPVAMKSMFANHPAIGGKRAELHASGNDLDVLKAKRFPSLTMQAAYMEDGISQGVVRLQQPLWAFGRINNPIKRSEAQHVQERYDLLRVIRQLMEETANAYVKVQMLKKREALASESMSDQQRLYEQIERRHQGKLASEADVLLASSRFAQAKAQHQQAAGELRVAVNALNQLTHTQIDASLPIDRTWVDLPDLDSLEQAALERSAEILFKKAALTVAVKSIGEERSSAMPILYVSMDRQVLDVPAGADETVVSIGLEAGLDGLGLATRGRMKGASSRAVAAQQDLEATRLEVQLRVRSLYDNRAMQEGLLGSQSQSISALAGTMSSYERQYAAGRKTWLEVLNIQRELAQQKLQHAQSEGEWMKVSLQLAIMTGTLDSMLRIEPTKE